MLVKSLRHDSRGGCAIIAVRHGQVRTEAPVGHRKQVVKKSALLPRGRACVKGKMCLQSKEKKFAEGRREEEARSGWPEWCLVVVSGKNTLCWSCARVMRWNSPILHSTFAGLLTCLVFCRWNSRSAFVFSLQLLHAFSKRVEDQVVLKSRGRSDPFLVLFIFPCFVADKVVSRTS